MYTVVGFLPSICEDQSSVPKTPKKEKAKEIHLQVSLLKICLLTLFLIMYMWVCAGCERQGPHLPLQLELSGV